MALRPTDRRARPSFIATPVPGRRPAIACSGELDLATAGELRRTVRQVLPDVGDDGLCLDLSAVPFADSSGIAELLAARRLLGGRPLRLLGLNPSLLSTLKLLSIDGLFRLDSSCATHH
jgi:anti-anti-sigma factor